MQNNNLFNEQEQAQGLEMVSVHLGEALEANEFVREHVADFTSDNPAVYCGTYAKYNDGCIDGAWLDLTTFDSYDDFIEVCKKLHRDEEDPELMFQDFENFPKDWYSESCMDEVTFNNIQKYADMNEEMREAFDDYICNFSFVDFESFEEAYCGKYNSEEDFATELLDDCYDIERMMGSLARYFDYEAFARDLFMTDYWMGYNGHVFRNC